MSKSGKFGVVVFFLFSIAAVIFTLKLLGNIEDKRQNIAGLTSSLEETTIELGKVKGEKTELEEQLVQERNLKAELKKDLSQKIAELHKENEEKLVLQGKFDDLTQEKTELENNLREEKQQVLNLKAILEKASDDLKTEVMDILPEDDEVSPPKVVEGEVMVIASPFLNVELDSVEVSGFKPSVSVYRKGELFKELTSGGIQYATLIAQVKDGIFLEDVKENDLVGFELSSGIDKLFGSSPLEGKVLDVINPSFLNVELAKEALNNLGLTLMVYRDGEIFKEIGLKDLSYLTVVIGIDQGNDDIKGIREKDKVILTP